MTLTSWSQLDPHEAEVSVRQLRAEMAETEAEVEAYGKLGSIDRLSFGLRLGLNSLRARRSELDTELQKILYHRETEIIMLALDGPDYPRHTATFGNLSSLLRSTQGLFTSIVQAVTTGPTARGPVPAFVDQISQLRLANTFPSSFGLAIEARTNRDAKTQATLERSLENLFSLLAASQNPDNLLEKASLLGPRVIGHLQSLVSRLHRSNTTATLSWNDSSGVSKDWAATEDGISAIAVSLSNIREPQIIDKRLSGILLGLSLLKGRFEILSDRGELFEGNVAEGILDVARQSFGTRRRFTFKETSTTNRLTVTTRTAYVLVGIDEADGVLGIEGLATFSSSNMHEIPA